MAHFFTRNMLAMRAMMDVAEGHRDLQLNVPLPFFSPLPPCLLLLFSFAAHRVWG